MALETLKGVKKIDGFEVVDMDAIKDSHPHMFEENGAMKWKIFEKEIRPNKYVYVRHEKNSLTFNIQNGPIKEAGVNGCQVDTIVDAAKTIIEGLQAKFPCRENALAITKLEEAYFWLKARKADREKRDVEGYSKK